MNCLKGSFRSSEVVKSERMIQNEDDLGRMPWLPLYRIQSQSMYKEGGSPDQGVRSLRERPI